MWIHLLSLGLIDGASPAEAPPTPIDDGATSTPGRRLYSYSHGETEKEKEERRKRWGLLVDTETVLKVEKAIASNKVGEFMRSIQAVAKVTSAPTTSKLGPKPRYVPDPVPIGPSLQDVAYKIQELLDIIAAETRAVETEESDMAFIMSMLANA